MIEIISDKDVKIRKPHRCCVCSRKFDVGTIMHNQKNKYDDIASVYTCLTCNELLKFFEPGDEGMYDPDCLSQEMYGDSFGGTPEEYLAFKIKQNSDRIELQSTCSHAEQSPDYHSGRYYNRCDSCQKLIKIQQPR